MISLYINVGVLDPVSNLTTIITYDNILDIRWTAPYSNDVPSTAPDITYCVDVFNTSPTSPTLMYSRCGTNQTSYQYTLQTILLACAEYQVAVIAANQVGNSSAISTTLINRVKGIKLLELFILWY